MESAATKYSVALGALEKEWAGDLGEGASSGADRKGEQAGFGKDEAAREGGLVTIGAEEP